MVGAPDSAGTPPSDTQSGAQRLVSRWRKRSIIFLSGIFALIGSSAAYYWATRSALESVHVGFRGEGNWRYAIFNLRNTSRQDVSFRMTKIFYRSEGVEWSARPEGGFEQTIRYRGHVLPGDTVEFPVRMICPDGKPLTKPVRIGITYTTRIAIPLPNSVRDSLRLPHTRHGVHWMDSITP